jgi:hypothetical protein
MTHFLQSRFTVLNTPSPVYKHGDVEVKATPDLYVEEAGKRKLIKLDFSAKKPDEATIEIILKVMHEAATLANLNVAPKDVIYLDVARQTHHIGAKLNARLRREVDAACETIADIWPSIKQK